MLLFTLFPFRAAFALPPVPPADFTPAVDKVAVLAYHHLEPSSSGKHLTNSAILPVEEFFWQMQYLRDNNFYTLNLEEMGEFLAGRFKPPGPAVLITFDDGYESNYVYALPVLIRCNFKAVIFPTGRVPEDQPGDPEKAAAQGLVRNRHLTTYQLKSMLRTGLLEFGCHTYDNHRYIGDKPALEVLDEAAIRADLLRFNKTFIMLGIPVPHAIAYPYGVAGHNAIPVASSMGYRLGFTVNPGYAGPGSNTMLINRFSIHPGDSRQFFTDVVNGKWK
ncbi:polysaccharide deacetylase [Desulfocucumis palustris]|uniref:Polysaccharide deacetylase n=2 Tax=Desulfocucumis palustris TaxID=1898651 RepID=A0A2L2XH34_9FIRM|nr:polysaccharide deacetylase [Desulfocucumis palustris]